MNVKYSVKNASKVKEKDLVSALKIYTDTVDKFSETNTNEILDYIKNNYIENRIMFFYVLYLNDEVYGFAEYAYLTENKVLFLDYLCTRERNHTPFYNYYHMIYEDISKMLESKKIFIEYIITELSLFKDSKILTDVDSNYFRQILSFERFHILNIPYKQPYLNSKKELEFYEYNLAIKKANSYEEHSYKYNKTYYINLINEIYNNHYLQWYSHYNENIEVIKDELKRCLIEIENDYPNESTVIEIKSVYCSIFDKGLCNQFVPENITLSKIKTQKNKNLLRLVVWGIISIITIIICYSQEHLGISKYVTTILSALSFFSGILSIIPYLKSKFIF